nr:hypothetical protein [Tanacetum cinerariifolium]
KKQKLDEEVKELKRHLQIVPNEEDDVYTGSTPLALKVPVVDYKIYNQNNKPYYKIKRANGSHQLYLSFLSLLRNFNIEDLEALWRLVKERFATIKPKNFFDDFLLITLRAMTVDMTIDQQVALDEALVPHASRLRIGKSNFRLRLDIMSKESTLQVVYDVLKLTLFYKAFLVTADVLEIYMQEFWATVTIHHHTIHFKMNNKK